MRISLLLIACCLIGAKPMSHPSSKGKIIFFDDFKEKKLDRSKWNVEVTGRHYNNELQAYVDSTATLFQEDGKLVFRPIYAPKFKTADGQSFDFISARINTIGKFDFQYGSAEARIRMSDGVGLWPAWWMLGEGAWPATGEEDIMEYIGDRHWASAAVHGPGYSGNTPFVSRYYFEEGDDITHWHNYAVDWTPDSLVFKYDGKPFYRVSRDMAAKYGPWAFDNKKYLILNIAVGGGYPAAVNKIKEPYYGLSDSALTSIKKQEARMWVDWVKVTQY